MRRRSGANAVCVHTVGPARGVARSSLVSWAVLCVVLLAWVAGSGCSLLRRYAVDQFADAVAHSDTALSSEEDPELVRAAAPFNLKLLESLLAESPQHQGLLSAAASGFTQYAFAFVQQDADELEARDLAAAEALRTRARRLYLRARNYGLRGLAVNHPGFPECLAGRSQSRGARHHAPLMCRSCIGPQPGGQRPFPSPKTTLSSSRRSRPWRP